MKWPHRLFIPAMLAVLAVTQGCLTRSEEITVDRDGRATIVAEFEGEVDDFGPPISLPAEPDWEILSDVIDSSDADKIERNLKVRRVVPYGEPLPETYATGERGDPKASLRFPGEIRYWKEGGRTFYEFKRTYLARRYFRFNGEAESMMDKDLEKRVLEKGIFEVSEEDRTKYLALLARQAQHRQRELLSEILGMLVLEHGLPVSVKVNIQQQAEPYIVNAITPAKLLAVLAMDEDSIGAEFDKLARDLQQSFAGLVMSAAGSDPAGSGARFETARRAVEHEYKLTEALNSNGFDVHVRLPGEIVTTNGERDRENPGAVGWTFGGEDLHDRDIPLHALSVVED
ncbi:MAG TPA: hypothetical protein VMY05_02625 [Acidobacteriota bacterium]|nr:hypothetical protein [Acidobacteriota bacterium]